MNGKQKGFTLIEILVVVTIIGVLAGLVVVLIPKGQFEAKKTECMNNIRNIVQLMVASGDYPKKYGGANLVLHLVPKGELEGEEHLKTLFCPGDPDETYEEAGKEEAYNSLDMSKRGEYGHLTSYAGRDQTNKNCRAMTGSTKMLALVCDDSENHHDGKGFVVGFTGGSVKFRHKFEDWQMDVKESVSIGEGSKIKELDCMRAD